MIEMIHEKSEFTVPINVLVKYLGEGLLFSQLISYRNSQKSKRLHQAVISGNILPGGLKWKLGSSKLREKTKKFASFIVVFQETTVWYLLS